MKKTTREKAKAFLLRTVRFILNPRLLLCFGIAWLITNGWCYLFLFFGLTFDIAWMSAVGGAYAAFLWLPFTPEKLVTVAIAVFLLQLLFPRDTATLQVLREMYARAKAALRRKKDLKGDSEHEV